jgi:hypothetical protein
MKTKRDSRLVIRIAGALLAALEVKAQREGRSVAGTARKMLVDAIVKETDPSEGARAA